MTRDDILRMAREAGMFEPGPLSQERCRFYPQDFAERFAALVYEQVFRDANYAATRTVTDAAVAVERERIAKLFDGAVWSYDYRQIAALIRAGGSSV